MVQLDMIQLGTLHIDRALDLINNKETIQLSNKWKLSKLHCYWWRNQPGLGIHQRKPSPWIRWGEL